ncbi:GIY-YIG nuclease family protein [Bacillus cereus]|uniref:Group I intron endonuclease n=1 Tax=Bacillus cereus (strain VD146) TaxID=1053236 RepID=R8MQY4_BACCX|nr:GIY-YIG nuclease family protein [Bacillus cereus]EOP36183.1 group I intron endonuclease [Bacillus cereus VD146]
MNKQGVIYKIENSVNGKVYIGQTIKDVHRRLKTHISSLRGGYHINKYLQKAFNKYGEENFKSEIIEKCTIEELDAKEIQWISYYKNTGMSYNIEGGGNLRKVIADETRKKLSISGKKSYQNPIVLAKRKKQWEELSGKGNSNSKEIICINDNKVFASITEAGEYYKISMKSISNSLIGRNPYCKSFDGKTKLEFCYYEGEKEYVPKKHIHAQSKAVRCITTGEIFESVAKASEKYSLYTNNISKVCKGKRKHTGRLEDGTRLRWEYCD